MNALHEAFHYVKHLWTAKKRHGIHSPLVYALSDVVFHFKKTNPSFKSLITLKEEWLGNHNVLEIVDYGAGTRISKGSSRRSISEIARVSTSDQKQAQAMYHLVQFLKPKAILELGTNLGWTSFHMALAAPECSVVSIEGSKTLHDFAESNRKRFKLDNLTLICSEFSQLLNTPKWTNLAFDLVYLDGNHRKEPTLNYCKLLEPYLTETAVIVVDDIYWSKEMTEAWEILRSSEKYSLTVDCFHFGLLFLEKRNQKEHFRLRI